MKSYTQGFPASRKLMKIGIEEQEQNGVTAPKGSKGSELFLSVMQALIFALEMKLLHKPYGRDHHEQESSIIYCIES